MAPKRGLKVEKTKRSAADLLPRKRPRQARAQETVAAILQAAAALIAEVGFAEATTNKIASRAGVSVGSLYQYFPNKSAILVSLLEQHIREVQPIIVKTLEEMADPGIPLATTIRTLFVRLVEAHGDNPRLYRVLAEEVPQPPLIRQMRREGEVRYARRVEQILRQRPDVEVHHPAIAAYVLGQAIDALTHWLVHRAPESFDRETYIDESVRMATAYLASSRSDPHRP